MPGVVVSGHLAVKQRTYPEKHRMFYKKHMQI
jgi:hypothetical protein